MAVATKHTEASMQALLQQRYLGGKQAGNGPAWAYVPQVRNAAGFDANRTCDGIAMALWPSRGLTLHGHEIKVSRSDWQHELADPSKAEAFMRLCDHWWLVVGDKDIVREGELPPGWGLMAPVGGSLKVLVQAGLLTPRAAPTSMAPRMESAAEYSAWAEQVRTTKHPFPPGFSRSFLAALLRAAAKTHLAVPHEVAEARKEERKACDRAFAGEREAWDRESRDYQERIRAFEASSGVPLGFFADQEHRYWARSKHTPTQVGAALRTVLDGKSEHSYLLGQFDNLASQAERIAQRAKEAACSGPQSDTTGA